MILEDTVLVLGGASMPYGFPSGEKLMNDIWQQIRKCDQFYRGLVACRFEEVLIQEFGEALAHEDRYSLDAFLETHPKFLEVGKAAIAQSLIPCEADSNIFSRREEGWHRYFSIRCCTVLLADALCSRPSD